MERENLFKRSEELGKKLLNGLEELKNHPNVGDVRGLGLLAGIEIVEDKETKKPVSNEKIAKLIAAAKAKGVIIGRNGDTVAGHNNILTLSPPLSSTDDDIQFIIKVLKEVFFCE
jgi:taurine-pyruvate aminotransferase